MKLFRWLSGKERGGDIAVAMATMSDAAWRPYGRFHIAFICGTGHQAIIEPPFPLRDFTVSLHWSKRFEADPGNRWLRDRIVELFAE